MRLLGIEAHHVHFGFSPARECLRGIAVLLHPARHAEQMPWVREARRRVPRDLRKQIERFRFFFEAPAEIFPFLWGSAGRPQFHAELRELRSSLSLYRDTVVRRISGKRLFDLSEMQRARRRDWYRAGAAEYSARHPWASEMLQDFVESPAESLKQFAGMVEEFHEKVFRTAWEPINARLIADIAMRKKILGAYGVAALMRTIDSDATVRRAPGGVSIEMPQGDHELEFFGDGGEALRFFCVSHHYRSPVDFEVQLVDGGVKFNSLEAADRALSYFYETLRKTDQFIADLFHVVRDIARRWCRYLQGCGQQRHRDEPA